MNNSKTEFVVFYPSRLSQYVSCDAINVNGEAIKASSAFKYLGVWLDQHLTMRKHISEKCRISMFNILRLKSIRPFLTMEATKTLASGIILSHLDYANSLFSGLPKLDTGKLQKVQSVCAKVVAGKTKYDSVTDTLKSLHWLSVHLRTEFKVLSLVQQNVFGGAPKYRTELISLKPSRRSGLRSNDGSNILEIPFTKRKT